MSMTVTTAILAEEMAAIERNAEYLGVSRLLLMENAGRAVASEILRRQRGSPSVVIFAGLGGNGGDGFVAARHLARRAVAVHLVVVGDPAAIRNEAAAANWRILQRMRHSIRTYIVRDASDLPSVQGSVVVDALLGTGARGAPRPPISQVLRVMNEMQGMKVAVDLPTGIHPDTGEPTTEYAFKADLTVTFHRPKLGLVRNKDHVGRLVVADIGIPPEAELYVGPGDVMRAIQPRPPYTHKGDFGHLLVVGGSHRYVGAPILASLGALRSGVDLVYLAAPRHVLDAATSQIPDLLPIPLRGKVLGGDDLPVIEEALARVEAVLVGPGLGDQTETLDTVAQILKMTGSHRKPVIIDADALKVITRAAKLGATTVITPHAGEFQRIAGHEVEEALSDRARQVHELARAIKCVVLLKGPVDVIATPTEVRLNWTGTPAMSVGGSGDVLAGLIAGFLAQGVGSFLAACAGAFINGAAGLLAYQEKGTGLIASDLAHYIPRILANPMTSPITYPPIPLYQ